MTFHSRSVQSFWCVLVILGVSFLDLKTSKWWHGVDADIPSQWFRKKFAGNFSISFPETWAVFWLGLRIWFWEWNHESKVSLNGKVSVSQPSMSTNLPPSNFNSQEAMIFKRQNKVEKCWECLNMFKLCMTMLRFLAFQTCKVFKHVLSNFANMRQSVPVTFNRQKGLPRRKQGCLEYFRIVWKWHA